MSIRFNRRRLMTLAAGTLAGLAGQSLFQAMPARAGAPINLTAGRRTLDIDGRAASVFGLTQPDGTSGLFLERGALFQVNLQNEIGVETLVHWHGLIPPYQQDGVPGVSAPPIPSGGSAQYAFPLDFAGTFFMHSHQGFQEQLLMSAPLIIREQGGIGDRQEIILMLHDFSFRSPEEIFAELRNRPSPSADAGQHEMPGMSMAASQMKMAPMAMDLNDVKFDAFLANDRTLADPQIVKVERRGRILLRIINAAASSNFIIDLGGQSARLVAVDGHAVQPVSASTFPIAMAQRLDLEFELASEQQVMPVFAQLEGERRRAGIALSTAGGQVSKLPSVAEKNAPPITSVVEQALRATTPLPQKTADRVHQVELTGSMAAYSWTLNGLPYGQDKPLMVAKGERVELVMTNRTGMSHPMHLHGHFFQVVAIDGKRFAGAVRDTVLVPPKQSLTIAFDANSPGRWAFHCHNLYHMQAGMMTTVQYEAG